jgi:twinkle protein
VLIIDPWNEIDHKRGKERERDGLHGARDPDDEALRQAERRRALGHRASVQAEPDGGPGRSCPGLYDISGSANWANKADYGIVFQIKNREYWTSTIACTKVRMGLPGSMGQTVVQFDPNKSSYSYYAFDAEQAA